MRVLFLGDSNDTGKWFTGGRKRHEIIGDRLTSAFGQPVEVIEKGLWPTAKMPTVVDRWIDEAHPDVVYLQVVEFWFVYQSVPLRMQRVLGRLGPAAGRTGFRLADSKRWAHNRVFRGFRRLVQATVGGDTHFSTQEVIDRVSECVRLAVRREGTVVVVRGPVGRIKHGVTKRQRRQNEQRRLEVHLALQALCGRLHVYYEGAATAQHLEASSRGRQVGDGLHGNARDAEIIAEAACEAIAAAVRLAGAESPQARTTREDGSPAVAAL